MIPQIASALAHGFNSKQLIDYIIRKYPEHADKIKSAMAAGFSVDQVLKYVSGGRKALTEEQPEKSIQTEHAQTRNVDIKRRENVNQGAISAAALAASPLAASMGKYALQRALPTNLAQQGTNIQKSLQPAQPSQQPPSISPIIQQAAQPIQPQGILNPKEFLEKLGIIDKVDALLKAKNPPEAIAAALGVDRSGKKSNGGDPELIQAIEAYSKQMPEAENPLKAIEPVAKEIITPETKLSPAEPLIEKEEIKPIAKNEMVASPHGVGEVKEIRNGKALIEIDGKKHQVNEEELIQSPLPEKELSVLYDEMIEGIEKTTGQQVSRNVEWAGYDPKSNELAYRPHGAKLYVYDNISPEDVDLLTSFLTKRKSTGENFIGAWHAGTNSPIGAAMYQLIQKLQKERGGKGNEYKNKYETIYDAIEPARNASKEKHARLKKQKKAKKPRLD